MKRREFITALGGAAATWPLVAQAQQPERIRRIGILSGFAEDHPEGQAQRAALFQGLRESGWIEGENFRIELFRWVTDDPERMHASVQDLVKLDPELILGLSPNPSDLAFLLKETNTIPFVFVNTADPIRMGLTSSLSRPNRNITGFTNFEDSIGGKWMQLLKQAAPKVARAGLLYNPDRGAQGF
jgi:putative ABC transport system substrate-binding protein